MSKKRRKPREVGPSYILPAKDEVALAIENYEYVMHQRKINRIKRNNNHTGEPTK